MSKLKEAGLITVAHGKGGISLARKASQISFFDVFTAVKPVKNGKLFKIHSTNEAICPAAQKIDSILKEYFSDAQEALEKRLKAYTLQDILYKIT